VMIIRLDSYANESGSMVTERVLVKGDVKECPFDRFIGTVGLGVMTEAGPQIEKIEFPIKADDLDGAFASFKSSADVFVKRLRSKMENEVVVPKKSGLILPGA
jgi:hypothetical protein